MLAALGRSDLEHLKRDMNDPEVARVVELDQAHARALNASKTPGFFVNGRPMPRFGFEHLRRLVLEELQSAYRWSGRRRRGRRPTCPFR